MVQRRKRRMRRRPNRRTRNTFNGGRVRGSVKPTTTSSSPWNSFTLTTVWDAPEKANIPTGGRVCVTLKQVRESMVKELSLKSSEIVDMRISRVDLWTTPVTANSQRNYVVFSATDWTMHATCGTTQMNWFEVWGTVATPAHLHYIWPRSMSIQVLPGGSDFPIFMLDVIEKSQYILKVHILWRIKDPDPRVEVLGTISSMRTFGMIDDNDGSETAFSPLADMVAITSMDV